MGGPVTLIIFDPLPNDFELSLLIKLIFGVGSIFILIFGLKVHQRILSFVKINDGRHVDQIIAFQSVVNCFLIPISLSWLVGLQWVGEMKQYISPQGCYIGTFIGILFFTFLFLFLVIWSLKVEEGLIPPSTVNTLLCARGFFFDVLGVFEYSRVANSSILGYIAKINFFQKGHGK